MNAAHSYASTMRIDLLLDSGNDKGRVPLPTTETHRIETLSQSVPGSDFDVLLQSIYDAALLTDFDGRVTNANERALRFFGFSAEAIRQHDIGDLVAGVDAAILETVIANVQSERFTLLQAHCIRKDESLFPAEISATCLRLAEGTSLCFFIRDISVRREMEEQRRLDEEALRHYQDHLEDLIRERTTELEAINNDLKRENAERLRVETDLRDAIQQLREHDQAKNMFVSNVSHELRTPLTALIHAIESLMRGVAGKVPDTVFSYLTMMLEDCWRLDRTVCDILDLSRIEAGRLELNTTNVPLRRMVERTVESLRLEAEEVPLKLDMIAGDNNGFVDCDAAKMERVIINIVNNAIKFTPPGGTVTVSIAQQARNGIAGICCRIRDDGIGIAPAYITRVTERFFRVGEQIGGTGLGLAIAKEIIERHQGALEIASPPPGEEKGTQVVIWLPTTEPQQIMIIAYDEGIRQVLEPALRERGYRVSSYQHAQHALQALHDGNHHIVIVGSTPPDMDGTEIVMHLKADPILRRLPVFLLTEDHPAPAKSSILSSFGIPVFLKRDGLHDLVSAVADAFLPQRIGVQERHAPQAR